MRSVMSQPRIQSTTRILLLALLALSMCVSMYLMNATWTHSTREGKHTHSSWYMIRSRFKQFAWNWQNHHGQNIDGWHDSVDTDAAMDEEHMDQNMDEHEPHDLHHDGPEVKLHHTDEDVHKSVHGNNHDPEHEHNAEDHDYTEEDRAELARLKVLLDQWPWPKSYVQPPDTRHHRCKDTFSPKKYKNPKIDNLPVTVIIPTFSDINQTIFRTCWSILMRTPPHLLDEILLIDDHNPNFSIDNQLGGPVPVPKVRVMRNPARLGLVRSKIDGAQSVRDVGKKSPILVFLEGHCEVNEMWLEPLIERIALNPMIVTVPVVDIMSETTREYMPHTALTRGGNDWDLRFTWETIPENRIVDPGNPVEPIMSPTMSGGLFAIAHDTFDRLGKYDPGQDIWGYENVEMSFRLWQCGASIEIIQCSRVGHVFRSAFPYHFPNQFNVEWVNRMRVAEVWMDDYKRFLYSYFYGNISTINYGDVSERWNVRNSLHCKDFTWFVQNVYPELQMKLYTAEQMNVRVAIVSVARGLSHTTISSFYSKLKKNFLNANNGYIKQYVLITDLESYAELSATMRAALPEGIKVVYIPSDSNKWLSNHFRLLLNHMTSTNLFDTSLYDNIYYIDAQVKFVTPVAFKQIQHELIGMEHPYYPRNALGFCKQFGTTDILNTGYHSSGEWSYCQFPFIRNKASAGYIPIDTGKHAPRYVTANSWFITSIFWGGKSGIMKQAMETIADWIDSDQKNDIHAEAPPLPNNDGKICDASPDEYLLSVHPYLVCDEPYLNAYMVKHQSQFRMLGPPQTHIDSSLFKQSAYKWLFNRQYSQPPFLSIALHHDIPGRHRPARAESQQGVVSGKSIPHPNRKVDGKIVRVVFAIFGVGEKHRNEANKLRESIYDHFCLDDYQNEQGDHPPIYCDTRVLVLSDEISEDAHGDDILISADRHSNNKMKLLLDSLASSVWDEKSKPVDYVYVMDADTTFVDHVAIQEWHNSKSKDQLIAVQHPFYPQTGVGFCGRYGNVTSSCLQDNGFDCKGVWTFCNYPYERVSHGAAYIPLDVGTTVVWNNDKTKPADLKSNWHYFSSALYGGARDRVHALLTELSKMVDSDHEYQASHGLKPEAVYERLINFYYHKHRDVIAQVAPQYAHPPPNYIQNFNMDWLAAGEKSIKIVHGSSQ